MENPLGMEVLIGKSLSDCQFSIAMFDSQRVMLLMANTYPQEYILDLAISQNMLHLAIYGR